MKFRSWRRRNVIYWYFSHITMCCLHTAQHIACLWLFSVRGSVMEDCHVSLCREIKWSKVMFCLRLIDCLPVWLSVSLPFGLFDYLSVLTICLSVYLFVCLTTCLSSYPSVRLSFCLTDYLSALTLCLSVRLSFCLTTCLSVLTVYASSGHQPVCPFIRCSVTFFFLEIFRSPVFFSHSFWDN